MNSEFCDTAWGLSICWVILLHKIPATVKNAINRNRQIEWQCLTGFPYRGGKNSEEDNKIL